MVAVPLNLSVTALILADFDTLRCRLPLSMTVLGSEEPLGSKPCKNSVGSVSVRPMETPFPAATGFSSGMEIELALALGFERVGECCRLSAAEGLRAAELNGPKLTTLARWRMNSAAGMSALASPAVDADCCLESRFRGSTVSTILVFVVRTDWRKRSGAEARGSATFSTRPRLGLCL